MILTEIFDSVMTFVTQTKNHLELLGYVVAVMWGAFIITLISGYKLLVLGITPRRMYGLVGIIFAPILHASFNHIFFNTIPFVVLSDFLLIYGTDLYFTVTIYISLLSGVLVWLFGRSLIHVGASSVITGYWSFLVINAYTHGGVLAYALCFLSIYYFAAIFFGIFPTKRGVSFEGHFFGLVSGIAVNYFYPLLPLISIPVGNI